MSSQVISVAKEVPPKNLKLLRYLRVMYFLGYLPISWKTSKDPCDDEKFFQNSTVKSFVMFFIDSALAMNFLVLYYIWHLLNMGKDFDLSLIWTPKYIVGIYDGVVTTALSQLFYFMFPNMIFWMYTYFGRGLTSLNKLLLKPWFKLKIKMCLLMTVALEIGIILHAIHVTDKWAGKNDIQKGLQYYLPTIISFGLVGSRLMTMKCFYDSLLVSILQGWALNKPCIIVNEKMSCGQWQEMRKEVKEWIEFYHTVTETFSNYLFFIMSSSAPTIILTVYMILTLPMSGFSLQDSYLEYIALGMMFVGFEINYMIVVNGCHNAFETINNIRTEILMSDMDDEISEDSENIIQRRREALVSILSTATPLHGRGFFNVNHSIVTSIVGAATTYIVVLVQFNMSEKPSEK